VPKRGGPDPAVRGRAGPDPDSARAAPPLTAARPGPIVER
jgi:hypothetical protein